MARPYKHLNVDIAGSGNAPSCRSAAAGDCTSGADEQTCTSLLLPRSATLVCVGSAGCGDDSRRGEGRLAVRGKTLEPGWPISRKVRARARPS